MRRVIDLIAAVEQLPQRGKILPHVAIGRCNDTGGPGHHMIAGKQRLFLAERKAHVVRHMARREQRFERPSRPLDNIAIGQPHIRNEIMIDRGIEAKPGRRLRRDAAIGIGRSTGGGLELGRERRMIGMRVGDEDVAHRFAPQRIEQGGQMRIVVRSRIDHRQASLADDECRCALEGEGTGIIGQHAADQRRHGGHFAGCRVEIAVETQFGHGLLRRGDVVNISEADNIVSTR